MKKYINRTETNDLMLVGVLLDCTTRIRKEWSERGNIDKEEHKSIKTAETYLSKFYKSVLGRLDEKSVSKILKRMESFELKIMDSYTLQKIAGNWKTEFSLVHIEREDFYDWCFEIIDIKCKNCSKDFSNCNLHNLLYDNFIPESSFGLDNCRYSYTKVD